MSRRWIQLTVASVFVACAAGTAAAVTREVADLQSVRFTYRQSVLNQLTYTTYREPFDELQTRPWNLAFHNIGRHQSLSPWPGQEGNYTRYLNALIGNNGTANVDNDADAIQGSLIRRETTRLAWGASGAYLSGTTGNNDVAGTASFSGSDDLEGLEARGAVSFKLSERRVLGAGVRFTNGSSELTDSSFETGVGGFNSVEEFDQSGMSVDFGMRSFFGAASSWDARIVVNSSTTERMEMSQDVDDLGEITGTFAVSNYDISDFGWEVSAGYNRLLTSGAGEMEFRVAYGTEERELDDDELSYTEIGGVITPDATLLEQDPVTATRIRASAKSIFEAGETEMFAGTEIAHITQDGSTTIDVGGLPQTEAIDDTEMQLGLTIGLRQPLWQDRLRFIVAGRADVFDTDRTTTFDTGSEGDDSSLSTSSYAIGLEAVLANVTFDLAWLAGEEAAVVPVELGLPEGSRRAVDLDRLVFSAAVAW